MTGPNLPTCSQLTLVSYGDPMSSRSFSGSTRSLAHAFGRAGALKCSISAKVFSPVDVLTGAFRVRKDGRLVRLRVSPEWLWSTRGVRTLSRRLERRIRRKGIVGPFLQVGTLLHLPHDKEAHYVLTDTTVRQCRDAGAFVGAALSDAKCAEAMRLQAMRFREARHIFTLSRWCADAIVAEGSVPEDKITVCYAGPNQLSEPGPAINRNPLEILFVGIDWERKNGPLLLEAFRRLRTRQPEAILTIVGHSLPSPVPGVRSEGFVNRDDPDDAERLAQCFSRASVLCHPAEFDPFPIAILEAGYAGLPCVAIDSGSRREAVIDGETGMLVPAADANLLADTLERMIASPERTRAMGTAAMALVHRCFTWDLAAKRILEAIERTEA